MGTNTCGNWHPEITYDQSYCPLCLSDSQCNDLNSQLEDLEEELVVWNEYKSTILNIAMQDFIDRFHKILPKLNEKDFRELEKKYD